MATKHTQILNYIESLPVGERISVRSIAKNLSVSEGTAYRAIKDAENTGLVSTIERVGTIRIERKLKENIEKLTFGEVVRIIDGDVLGGEAGLSKVLNRFIIGAMKEDAMLRYITPESLMIVGNRPNVQELALRNGAAVLITGGFDTTKELMNLANRIELPILRTTYDTFTVATMINRAMSDQLIKKDIMLVGDIYIPVDKTKYLYTNDTIQDYHKLTEESGHSRFPVVNKNLRLVGIITAKDVIGKAENQSLDKVMTRDPDAAKEHMSVASIGHLMIWDGLEVMPVVKDDLTLIGIISRQDVMKAMQLAQSQSQITDTIFDQITGGVTLVDAPEEGVRASKKQPRYRFVVSPQMVNSVGTISFGVLSEIVATAVHRTIAFYDRKDVVVEQMSLNYFRLIQLESDLTICPRVLEMGRRSAKLDVEIFFENTLVAKAFVVCQLMERS